MQATTAVIYPSNPSVTINASLYPGRQHVRFCTQPDDGRDKRWADTAGLTSQSRQGFQPADDDHLFWDHRRRAFVRDLQHLCRCRRHRHQGHELSAVSAADGGVADCARFRVVNGFHDTANAVATVIYTHSLPAEFAVMWSGFFNFLGVLFSTGAVAFGIVSLLPVELILQVGSSAGFAMVFALLIAAI